ncbi:bifunctional 5,10-methylenetetrahydrofolate dehydrogenase/5,10-methenyltetrahydrofolate cyclohydrolase [Candidatus Uhrbacteria bacterium]|nr:bifunctional 5,10-methylenetetrahydrofolate dehydrogenase/5,10-methenyltetrahydrofolate cyclohydrolase [Candidatus Uhrbacteria bacterium]
MTEILNGNVLAKNIREKAAQRIANLPHPPGLAVILVGDNPASHLYVGLKEQAAREVGIYIEKFLFASDAPEKEIIGTIKKLNKRDDIHGILVQLPLPTQNVDKVIAAIDYKKDVDGFHPENRKLLLANTPNLVPPVSLAVMRMLQASRLPLNGKSAVILGNSAIFAEPIIELMKEAGVEATFLPRTATALAAKTRAADILVVAVGAPNALTKDMVKEGAIVIDVGTNKVDGKVVGDASPELVGHAGFMSKVPGGVGPLTVAYLLFNVIKAMEVQGR